MVDATILGALGVLGAFGRDARLRGAFPVLADIAAIAAIVARARRQASLLAIVGEEVAAAEAVAAVGVGIAGPGIVVGREQQTPGEHQRRGNEDEAHQRVAP
jgi:hypothetical protein